MDPEIRGEFGYREVKRLRECEKAEAQKWPSKGCGQEIERRAAWASDVMLQRGKGGQVTRPCVTVGLQWISSGKRVGESQSCNSDKESDC